MRTFLSCGMVVATAFVSVFAGARQALAAGKPNVVVLLADDMGNADVGWRGGDIRPPNLDRLAAAGAKLDSFYAMPVCSPTRASLMTGRYPFRYGLQVSVVKPWASYGLPTDERTLPQALRDAGYETAIVGKWHLGHSKPEYLPMARGFEHQYGHYNGALDYFTHVRDGGYDWHRDDKRCDDQGYSTELLGAEAVRLIERRDRSRPLFLYLPFQAVHDPLEVPGKYSEPYNPPRPRRKKYMGMVAALDLQVGRVLDALKANGMEENTVVFFSSDNGGPAPGIVTSNGDLREGKGTLYEGGVRVCASATWPGVIPAGSTVTHPLHMVDLYATILALAGAKLDQPKPVDGRDILPLLEGADQPAHDRDEVIINVAPNSGAIREGNWKLVVNGFRHIAEEAADPSLTLKRPTEYELFDLAADRQEKHDLAKAHPDVVARLNARLETLSKTAAPAFSEAKDPNFKSPKVWGEFDDAPATRPAGR